MRKIAAALRELGDAEMTEKQAAQLAKQLGVHPKSLYRYRRRLIGTGEITSIKGRKRGWVENQSRLSEQQEVIIRDAIGALRSKAGPFRVVDLVDEVTARCRIERIPIPSRPTIDRRLKRHPDLKVKRHGKAAAGSVDPRISPGTYAVEKPLDVVQIDHTTMDIVLVDDLYRKPLTRPYLTIATDVATRCVLGFVISFIPPGANTVSLCLTIVISPKDQWLRRLNIDSLTWPMYGLPKAIHLDRAAEFKSKALRRGCSEYGIELLYRKRPHYGGHVERLLGTKMSKLKALPGATGGSPKSRREFDPNKHAALTLGELETWFARQIVSQYHHTPHRGLKGGTPAAAWEMNLTPSLPPASVRRFRIAFLPSVSRALRREGIVFHHLRYWHPIFAQWLGVRKDLVIHFDPNNLAKLFLAHENDYLEVGYADLRQPAVSLWEAVAASKHLKSLGQKSINSPLLIQSITAQRELVDSAKRKTRKLRRKPTDDKAGTRRAIDPIASKQAVNPAPEVDWSQPAKPYRGEKW